MSFFKMGDESAYNLFAKTIPHYHAYLSRYGGPLDGILLDVQKYVRRVPVREAVSRFFCPGLFMLLRGGTQKKALSQ